MKSEELGAIIRGKRQESDRLLADINRIAQAHIPEFHWMDHEVHFLFRCDKSPIGMCVHTKKWGLHTIIYGDCIFCHNPWERK